MSNKLQNFEKEMNAYKLGNPKWIDYLYRPYITNYEVSPLKYPYSINSGYPLNDPYRRFLGKSLNFRSQYNGYCPPGYTNRLDKNSAIDTNMCYPNMEENDNDLKRTLIPNSNKLEDLPPTSGTFYSALRDAYNPIAFTNSYGQTLDSPISYATTPYNGSVSNGTYGCSLGNLREANGKNFKGRADIANCITSNFW